MEEHSIIIVSGYIREARRLFVSTQCKLFSNIPSLITSICVEYYYIAEGFEIGGQDMIISEDGKTVSKNTKEHWNNTSYGYEIIPSNGSYYNYVEWQLKINYSSRNHDFIVGISSNTKNVNDEYFNDKRKGNYGYWSDGLLIAVGDKWGTKRYANVTCTTNDMIGIHLDLEKKELSFSVNGVNYGTAFKNIACGKNIKYRLAISAFYNHSSISIAKFYGVNR
eukprot:454119_1